jgi:hypothetical protein
MKRWQRLYAAPAAAITTADSVVRLSAVAVADPVVILPAAAAAESPAMSH